LSSKYRKVILDAKDDHGVGEIVANQVGSTWAAESGDDDLAEIVADTRFGTAQVLRVHDEDRTKHSAITKTFPISLKVGDRFGFDIHPVTGDYALDTLDIKLREGATVLVWLRVVTTTGVVQYTEDGAAFSATSITLTLDAATLDFEIEFTSTTTFKLRTAGGAWTTAYNNNETISSATAQVINKVEIASREANDDGGVASAADEDFADGTDGNSLSTDGHGKWTDASGSGSTARFHSPWPGSAPGAGMCSEFIDGGSYPDAVFTLPGGQAASGWNSIVVVGRAAQTSGRFGFWLRGTGANMIARIDFWESGQIRCYHSGGGTFTDIQAYSANTDYLIELQFDLTLAIIRVRIDGGSWTNGNFYTASADAIDMRFVGADGTSGTWYYDTIECGWTGGTVYTAGDTDVYIGNFYGYQVASSDTAQRMAWSNLSTNSYKLAKCLSFKQADDSILTLVEDTSDSTFDVYRITGADYDTWTKVIDTGSAGGSFLATAKSDGTIYCIYKTVANKSYLAKSTNYGVTWTINADTNYHVIDMFCINDAVFILYTDDNASPAFYIKEITDDTPTFTARANWSVAKTFVACIHGFYPASDDTYYFWILFTDKVYTYKYDVSAATGYQMNTPDGTDFSATWERRLCGILDHTTSFVFSTSGNVYLPLGDSSTVYEVWFSTDGGDDYTVVETGVWLTSQDEFLDGSEEQIIVDTQDLQVRMLNTNTHSIACLPNPAWTGYTTCINVAGDIILASSGSATKVFKRERIAFDGITSCSITDNIAISASMPATCTLSMTSDHVNEYVHGALMEIYDAWNTLWFKGRVVQISPAVKGGGIVTFTSVDCKREIGRPYITDADSKASAQIAAIVATLSEGYAGTFEDVNYAGGNVDYHHSLNASWQSFLRIYRIIERAVVYTTPDGAWSSKGHGSCTATKLRFRHDPRMPVTLIDNEAPQYDHRVTRSSCQRTTNLRYSYVGNATREKVEGVVACEEVTDLAIQDEANGSQEVAEQLYNIFSTASYFMHFLVQDHGFIQPGTTIDVSWTLGDVVVARQNMIVIASNVVDANSDLQEIVLSNNILIESEYDNLEVEDR